MPRKPNAIEAAHRAGYKAGWDARSQRSILDDPSLLNWGDWIAYTIITIIAIGGALAIFALLTLWIGWASDHHNYMHCGITPDNTQWCYHDDR